MILLCHYLWVFLVQCPRSHYKSNSVCWLHPNHQVLSSWGRKIKGQDSCIFINTSNCTWPFRKLSIMYHIYSLVYNLVLQFFAQKLFRYSILTNYFPSWLNPLKAIVCTVLGYSRCLHCVLKVEAKGGFQGVRNLRCLCAMWDSSNHLDTIVM